MADSFLSVFRFVDTNIGFPMQSVNKKYQLSDIGKEIILLQA